MNRNSDLDVLVVMPDGSHRRKTAQLLYRQIAGLGIPFDVVVATPADLQQFGTNKGLIYETILREGVEVYTNEAKPVLGNEEIDERAWGRAAVQSLAKYWDTPEEDEAWAYL